MRNTSLGARYRGAPCRGGHRSTAIALSPAELSRRQRSPAKPCAEAGRGQRRPAEAGRRRSAEDGGGRWGSRGARRRSAEGGVGRQGVAEADRRRRGWGGGDGEADPAQSSSPPARPIDAQADIAGGRRGSSSLARRRPGPEGAWRPSGSRARRRSRPSSRGSGRWQPWRAPVAPTSAWSRRSRSAPLEAPVVSSGWLSLLWRSIGGGVSLERREVGIGGRLKFRSEMGGRSSELDKSWRCVGGVLVMQWHCACTAPALHWHSAHSAPALQWRFVLLPVLY